MLRELTSGVEVLLLRRAGGAFASTWCPLAGQVDPGEAPAAAIERELREETCLELERLVHLPIRILQPSSGTIEVFAAFVAADAPVRLNCEHSAYRWLSFSEARPLVPLDQQREALAEVERVVVGGARARPLEFIAQSAPPGVT